MSRRKRHEELANTPAATLVVVGILVGAGGGWLATTPREERAASVQQSGSQPANAVVAALSPEPRPFRRFSGCNDARAAGYENITADEPSYRPEWDGDQDGIACEPHR